jgi:hypothetical protein
MSARKGRRSAPERAFQKRPKGMRQKIKKNMARVRPSGAILAQRLLGRESSSKEGESEVFCPLTVY